MEYDAFISYSHRGDDYRAAALQHALEHIARAFYRRRALKIFRDETSLSANPALWRSIELALSKTQFFILLASPESASSPWCAREVAWWLANRPRETLLIVLTGGELVFDDSAHDFDWERTTALSSSLATTFSSIPLYCDLRWTQRSDDLSRTDARFRAAVLPIAAALHGQEPQELEGEDLRQFRRTRRFWQSAAAGLALLTIASGVATWIAVRTSREAATQRDSAVQARETAETERDNARNAREAELIAREAETGQRKRAEQAQRLAVEQRDEAVRQRNLAVARQLAIKAEFLQNDKAGLLPQSMLLAAESLRRAPSIEADRTLRRGLALLPQRVAEAHFVPYMSEQGLSASRETRLAFFSLIPPGNPELHVVEFSWNAFRDIATWRPDTAITSIGFDSTASHLAMGGEQGAIYVWNPPKGAPRKVFDCGSEASAVAVSKTFLAAGCGRGPLHLINLVSGATIDAEEKSSGIIGLAFSSDEKRLAGARMDGSLVVWQTDGWKELLRTRSDYPGQFFGASVVAFSPDGEMVTKASPVDRILHVWDVRNGKEISQFVHDDIVLALEFSGDGRLLATASANGKARVFEIATGGLVREVRHQGAVRSVRFAKRDTYDDQTRLIATASEDRTARIWLIDTGREVTRAALRAPVGWVIPRFGLVNRFVVLDYDGNLELLGAKDGGEAYVQGELVSPIAASWSSAENAFVLAYKHGHSERIDPERKRANANFGDGYTTAGNRFDVNTAIWSADCRRLLMAGASRMQVWDAVTRRKLLDRPCRGSAALSADGATYALKDSDTLVRVFRLGEEVPRTSIAPPKKYWSEVKLAVSRGHIAIASSGDLFLKASSPMSDAVIEVTNTQAKAVVFSPDEHWLAWAGWRPGVLNLKTRREVKLQGSSEVRGSNRVLFTPDSSRVAIATSPMVAVWSLPDGRRIASAELASKITSLAFSRDGLLLATGDEDGTTRVWRVADGLEIARIEFAASSAAVPQPITALAFSANREILLTSTAGASRLWNLSGARLVEQTCRLIKVPLTEMEWSEYAGTEPYPATCGPAAMNPSGGGPQSDAPQTNRR